MTTLPLPVPALAPWSLRRAVRLPRAVPRLGGRRPSTPDPGPLPTPVVTVHADPGCDVGTFARAVAESLGVRLLDDDLPARVAAAEGVPVVDVAILDGTAPSPLLQAVLWSGFTSPSPEILGAVAEADLITRCFHRTEDVIREAAADGAVVVGRAGMLVLAGHPTAVHVRVTAPDECRAAALGGDEARAVADRAVDRLLRHGYRTRLADVAFDLVVERADDDAVHLAVAAARLRLDRAARERAGRG